MPIILINAVKVGVSDCILFLVNNCDKASCGVTASANRFAAPTGLAQAGNKLVVVDRDAHRVLIYRGLPLSAVAQPELVLGQPSFNAQLPMNPSATELFFPSSASSDGTALAVTDTNNHRVLIWKTLPAQDQLPDIVLGQANFTTVMQNRGLGKVAKDTLSAPQAVFADDKSIYVSDTGNNRILIWNTLDPQAGQAADLVLGQSNFDTGAGPGSINETALSYPIGLAVAKGRMYAVDLDFSRVVYWNSVPTLINKPFDGYLGQPMLNSGDRNAGGISLKTLSGPTGILVTEAGIYIADTSNHRVIALPPLP